MRMRRGREGGSNSFEGGRVIFPPHQNCVAGADFKKAFQDILRSFVMAFFKKLIFSFRHASTLQANKTP